LDAYFFKLNASPKKLAGKIRAYPAIQARQLRRKMILRLDWRELLSKKLFPWIS
jgi:hypothetical protein